MHKEMNRIGEVLVDGFHYLALFAIGGAIVWSAVHAFMVMAGKGHAGIFRDQGRLAWPQELLTCLPHVACAWPQYTRHREVRVRLLRA